SFEVGYGIKVQLEHRSVRVGSTRFMQREGLTLPEQLDDLQQQAEEQGHSLIYVGIDNSIAGVLEMQPSIRPEAHQVVKNLQQRGLSTYIISGDQEQATRNIAKQLGVDHFFAETLPEQKADLINQLRDDGKFVCFIGDGINDAIALKSAQISISLKGASSAATDTAQIIFMDGSLAPLDRLFQFTDEFERTMRNNLLLSTGCSQYRWGVSTPFRHCCQYGYFLCGHNSGLDEYRSALDKAPGCATSKTREIK
ncbi:MAG: HAD-IC family P-type ATPase, partial [Pseudomonadota bacterium]